MNVATGCPSPYGPSAVTVTVPALDGSVKVTDATPELFVTAMTFAPLLVPFDTVPAVAVNSTLAPVFVPRDCPGFNVTVKATGSVVPTLPVCPSPPLFVNVAAGFPTTIHPPCVCVTVPSLPVTVKWQNAGAPGAVTVIAPLVLVIVDVPMLIEPPVQAVEPSNPSNTADDNVTVPVPLVMVGFSVTVPLAGTMIVSGFKSHSTAGAVARLPGTTSKVAVYGAKVCVDDQFPDADTIAVGELCDSVYVVSVPLGVNPVVVNATCAAFPDPYSAPES